MLELHNVLRKCIGCVFHSINNLVDVLNSIHDLLILSVHLLDFFLFLISLFFGR